VAAVVKKDEPPRPTRPGFYTRLVVKTLYHGNWYSTWSPFEGNSISELEAKVKQLDRSVAMLESISFQHAHPDSTECDMEYVVFPTEALRTGIIQYQMIEVGIKRPTTKSAKEFLEQRK